MKKIIALILAAVCAFCMTACGNENTKDNDTSTLASTSSNVESELSNSSSKPQVDYTELAATVKTKAQEALKSVVKDSMTPVEKAKIAYEWLYWHFKYRAQTVDVSNGYTDELTLELASYYFKYHKGSCEHYAAAQKVLLEELGFEVKYVEGDRIDSGSGQWGEHVWVMINVDGNWYHVDGLFGGNHTAYLQTMFCVPDSAIESTHRWDKSKYPACTNPQILK